MRILHAFNYALKDINLEEVKHQGFDAVQISPIQPLKQDEFIWWVLYQPCGFTIGNKVVGSKEELIKLCSKAHDLDIKIICDVIVDHVAGQNQNDLLEPNDKVDKRLTEIDEIWKPKINCYNFNSRFDVTQYCIGMPGLKTENKKLQKIILKFLNELIECGVEGFRFDAAKHIALPEEGNDFWKVINNELPDTLFNYAEVIFSDKETLDSYSKYVNVLTEGRTTDPDKTIAFVESHDTLLEFKITGHMSDETLLKEYEIIVNNFKNTLFLARPFSNLWKSDRIREINNKNK